MSFNINLKQPPKPKVKMNDSENKANQIGMNSNALSQKELNAGNLDFGNTTRDVLLEKQLKEVEEKLIQRIEALEQQVLRLQNQINNNK